MNRENYKKCSKCGRYLTYDNFHKDKTKKDGLHHCCKSCKNEYSRQYNKIKKFIEDFNRHHDITIEVPKYDGRKSPDIEDIVCGVCGKTVNKGYIIGYIETDSLTGLQERVAVCRNCIFQDDILLRVSQAKSDERMEEERKERRELAKSIDKDLDELMNELDIEDKESKEVELNKESKWITKDLFKNDE